MLIRILVDNPGETFTRALDADFVETMRKLLKHARENRVRNMAMEMLDDFEHTKMYDENLQALVLMWKAQKEEAVRKRGVCRWGSPVSLPPHKSRNIDTSWNRLIPRSRYSNVGR